MKIIYKLTLGFLLVSSLVVVVAYFGISASDSIHNAHDRVEEETLPVIKTLDDMKHAGMVVIMSTDEYIYISSENRTESALLEAESEKIASGEEFYASSFKRYEGLVNKFFPEEKESLENIRIAGQKLQNTSSELIELKKQGVSGLKVQEKHEELEEEGRDLFKAIDDALAREDKEFAERMENLHSSIETTKKTILSVSLLTLISAIAMGAFLSNRFSKPILELKNAAVALGKGKLDTRVEIKSSDEVGILATCFNQMADRLEQDIAERKRAEELRLENEHLAYANRIKNEFLERMSHELRTPLNAIIGFSELLKQKIPGELNKKQEQYIDNIYESGKHLLSIISGILDLVQVESGREIELVINRFKVTEAIDEGLNFIKNKAMQKNVIIKKELDPQLDFIEADEPRFRQILTNLLDNAVKFSKHEGGAVTITAKKEGDMARFSVSDTGVGIKEEDLRKLFQRFEQLDSGTTRKHGGAGLGFAISKQLVELHGGRIWAESKYGEGSTFTFLLPLKAKNGGE